jgi:hypothetical protein
MYLAPTGQRMLPGGGHAHELSHSDLALNPHLKYARNTTQAIFSAGGSIRIV